MENYTVLIIIILILFVFCDYSRYEHDYYKPKYNKSRRYLDTQSNNPLYFNLDIDKVCKAAASNANNGDSQKDQCGKVDDEVRYKYLNECEKKKIQSCPQEKTLEEQLEDYKQVVKELKLELNDKTPAYDFNKSDRYFVDKDLFPTSGDDKFTIHMQEMQKRSKQSLDARSMWSTNSLIPYLEEELQMHENSGGWWEDSNLEALM